MYTLQSGQIENALRSSGVNDASAKQMVQGLANCQQPLQHRANVTLSAPVQNFFPTMEPARGTPLFPPSFTLKQIFIDIPPWQNIPFTPIPYPDWPEWQNTDYWEDPVFTAEGPVRLGPIASPRINTRWVNSTTVTNSGDIINEGDVFIDGSTTINADLTVNRHTTLRRFVRNYGPTYNYKNANFYSEVYVDGRPMWNQTLDVVTDVTWDGSIFRKKMRKIQFLGRKGGVSEQVIADCTV